MTNVPAGPANFDRNRPVVEDLRRWRGTFGALVLLIAVLAGIGFLIARNTSRRAERSATLLAAATSAQRAIWLHEHALRRFGLGIDSASEAAAEATRLQAEQRIDSLLNLTVPGGVRRARVDSVVAAFDAWERAFADPIIEQRRITVQIARDGTIAFDEVSRHLEQFLSVEAQTALGGIASVQTAAWGTFLVLLATLLFVAATFRSVAGQLESEAARAIDQANRLEAQATEVEQQARTLEDQAAQLEETAAELQHRVDERDETNRLLHDTATFLDSAGESAPFGIAFYGRDLMFLRVNAALAALSGESPEAHTARASAELLPVLGPRLVPVLSRVLRTGVAESDVALDGEVPASGPTPRRWLLTCYPLRPRGRPPMGVGLILLDVTERNRLEEQLRQAQKMEAVGRLAGGIAHDFNNVLTIIQSYSELLASGIGAKEQGREEVDAIRSAADRAAALARQLLSFSRREVVIPRVLDLNQVIAGMEQILRRLLRQGIDFKLDLADQQLLVRGDAGQLEQVLMNLAINAVDAMPDGGTLSVSTLAAQGIPGAVAATPAATAVIRVRDTGTGMSRETQEMLFEPFFTTKPPGRGTGLGLATAYAIVHGIGGVIRVVSTEGEGSTFDVILPRRTVAEFEPDSRLSPARGMTAVGGGEVVLLVEDDPAIRGALARMLRASGYRVIEVSNGGEALRLAEEEPGVIDLLLTDVMMPGIGGKELVQRLLKVRPGTRIILMSGYTDDEGLRRDLGDARYVFRQKPFAARQVVAAVRDVLDAD